MEFGWTVKHDPKNQCEHELNCALTVALQINYVFPFQAIETCRPFFDKSPAGKAELAFIHNSE